jgi:NTP pyrophosphatase (non-canonical NTP hydrolase)
MGIWRNVMEVQERYIDYMRRLSREEDAKMVSNTKLDSPINDIQQLMAITAEECGELTQMCMKIMRKYDNIKDIENDKYREMLVEELGDVQCMIELMIEHGVVTQKEIKNRAEVKRKKLKKWSTLVE